MNGKVLILVREKEKGVSNLHSWQLLKGYLLKEGNVKRFCCEHFLTIPSGLDLAGERCRVSSR
jgi:hypothetical protein